MEISVKKIFLFFCSCFIKRYISISTVCFLSGISQQIVLSLSVCAFSNFLNKSCSTFSFEKKMKKKEKMKTFEKFFKCFKFLEKNTFFRKKKFTLPGFLLFCCAVFWFMHSYTPMLFCCRLCQGQAFAPPLHRRCFAGGAKQAERKRSKAEAYPGW